MSLNLITAFVGSFLASLGFGALFNIRGRLLFFAGLGGAIGGLFYQLGMNISHLDGLSNFMGAVAFSLAGEIMARTLKTTVTTFSAPALIPLVPGGTLYQMMVQFMDSNIYTGLELGIQSLTVAGSLALGMMTVSVMTRLYYWVKKKV